jgi:hypothetical protein
MTTLCPDEPRCSRCGEDRSLDIYVSALGTSVHCQTCAKTTWIPAEHREPVVDVNGVSMNED